LKLAEFDISQQPLGNALLHIHTSMKLYELVFNEVYALIQCFTKSKYVYMALDCL